MTARRCHEHPEDPWPDSKCVVACSTDKPPSDFGDFLIDYIKPRAGRYGEWRGTCELPMEQGYAAINSNPCILELFDGSRGAVLVVGVQGRHVELTGTGPPPAGVDSLAAGKA